MNKGILLSGGIDSIALSYWKRPDIAFTLNYGQEPALAEIGASKAVCSALNIRHEVIEIDCSKLGSGDLLKQKALDVAPSTEWWPYRNQLLITLACMKAISYGIKELMVGAVRSDGFHKDGTVGFFSRISELMQYQEGNISISAPGIDKISSELVIDSGIPPDILFYAHSCHMGNMPCGHCRGCNKYIEVTQQLSDAGWKKS
ncbi:MAG: 7-cyano-7-deazaguanine synthase [Candidatus Pseudobacter hemicellulosilyticus]|uniref:7-cyano-7-deazaguanine synthase n=1 Tax=Candidatus Pseudobacter hemicellulosilyticus TaxID=3121375 RepID=A0AAJ5WP67_9BACT|nr:MAG: 7-cyano-7-deazaguanine synthase [Pseudobacter sp.]